MDVKKIQEQIDSTDYCDAHVYDVRASYCCDEVDMFVECFKDESCVWRFHFGMCSKFQLSTDAVLREREFPITLKHIRDMRPLQMDYFSHYIVVSKCDTEGFLKFQMDLDFMNMTIECAEFSVSKELKSQHSFWWDKNNPD